MLICVVALLALTAVVGLLGLVVLRLEERQERQSAIIKNQTETIRSLLDWSSQCGPWMDETNAQLGRTTRALDETLWLVHQQVPGEFGLSIKIEALREKLKAPPKSEAPK